MSRTAFLLRTAERATGGAGSMACEKGKAAETGFQNGKTPGGVLKMALATLVKEGKACFPRNRDRF